MIIPLFMIIVLGIIEFSLYLTVKIGVTNSAQDTAQYASQLGNTNEADFLVLQQVEKDVSLPLDKSKILSVQIYWTDSYGVTNKGEDKYTRGGPLWNQAHTLSVPYTLQGTKGYPESNRCNIVAGCSTLTPTHPTVDYIGVTITYQSVWYTPLSNLVALGDSPPIFIQTSVSRLEPNQ